MAVLEWLQHLPVFVTIAESGLFPIMWAMNAISGFVLFAIVATTKAAQACGGTRLATLDC